MNSIRSYCWSEAPKMLCTGCALTFTIAAWKPAARRPNELGVSANQRPALVRTAFTLVSTLLAMLHVMSAALFGAGFTYVRTEATGIANELGISANQSGCEVTEGRTVPNQADTLDHHGKITLMKAGV